MVAMDGLSRTCVEGELESFSDMVVKVTLPRPSPQAASRNIPIVRPPEREICSLHGSMSPINRALYNCFTLCI